jgi:glycosyltransferase involved in cell wall biosynthesis
MKLSILIPTLTERAESFVKLNTALHRQINNNQLNDKIEILFLRDNREVTIGRKRNELLQAAKGEYIAFIDDDDRINHDYIELVYNACCEGKDCCSLIGEITFDGEKPKLFYHSIEHNTYWEDDKGYYRPPNHLNAIKREIAKRFYFPEQNYGEDTDFAMQVCNARALKTEAKIDKVIYYYDYISKK